MSRTRIRYEKQWEEIMEVCLKDQSGQLPGKMIVFAMTKKHAERVSRSFRGNVSPTCRSDSGHHVEHRNVCAMAATVLA